MPEITRAVRAILRTREHVPLERAALIGVTGIDGCGKGYVTGKIVPLLRQVGVNAVGINVDGWLNLPNIRYNPGNPAQHFYDHAIRFDEMFEQLILPLRDKRRHRVVADVTEETATEYRQQTYHFEDVDIIVLEGIYQLKRTHRGYFDFSFWVDCTFDTALERALVRRQEGLSPEETIRAYDTIYFPAQRIHFAKDDPQTAAGAIITNDPRLAGRTERQRSRERH